MLGGGEVCRGEENNSEGEGGFGGFGSLAEVDEVEDDDSIPVLLTGWLERDSVCVCVCVCVCV